MSSNTRKTIPILKTSGSRSKTQKRVVINTDMNEGYIQTPHPLTPRTRKNLWTHPSEASKNREYVKHKKTLFLKARQTAPKVAATIARGRYKTGSPPSPKSEDFIQLKRGAPVVSLQHEGKTWREVEGSKGIIPNMVGSVFRFFGKKGGRKTRKNK